MLRNRKRRTFWTTASLLLCLVPFSILGCLSLYKSMDSPALTSSGLREAVRVWKKSRSVHPSSEGKVHEDPRFGTMDILRREKMRKLEVVRQIKRSAIERYFRLISDQMRTFSEEKVVVAGMKKYAQAFHRFEDAAQLTDPAIERLRAELASYYEEQFKAVDAEQPGTSADFGRILGQLQREAVALQYYCRRANLPAPGSNHELDDAEDFTLYSRLNLAWHPVFLSYLQRYEYYDIFLADAGSGQVVYSVIKKLEFGTSLITGPFAESAIGRAFRLANAADDKDAVVLTDFAQYTPSYGAPASFIASPIFDGDKKIGVVIFQIPIDRLNQIMSEIADLDRTEETCEAGADDHLLRFDSSLRASDAVANNSLAPCPSIPSLFCPNCLAKEDNIADWNSYLAAIEGNKMNLTASVR